ncbi:hypothetical protein GCM10009853_021370 [Glycomyces scopariae]
MNTKLGPFRRLLAVGGVALAGTVALTGCSLLESASPDDTESNEVTDEQADQAADAAPGDCLPEVYNGPDATAFTVECDAPEAFWTLTAIEKDPAVTASADGSIEDPAGIYALCGDEVNAQLPGKPWTDWDMIYDPTSLKVDYLYCIEALGTPNAAGVTPVVPSNAGECFSTADWNIGVYDCADPLVDATLVSVIEVDQAEWETVDYDTLANEQCTSASYAPAMDYFGRTAAVFCID